MTDSSDAPSGDEYGAFEVSEEELVEVRARVAAAGPGQSLTLSRTLLETWGQQVYELAVETRRGPRLVALAAAGTEGSVQESLQWAQDLADRVQTLLVQMDQMDLVPASVSHAASSTQHLSTKDT